MDLSPLLLLEKKSGSTLSSVVKDDESGVRKEKEEEEEEEEEEEVEEVEEVIDLIGGMSRGALGDNNKFRLSSGGRGGTLDALMSISANRGRGERRTNPILSVVRGGDGGGSPASAAARSPTLSIYECQLSTENGRPTRIMRVHSSHMSELSHGDIMACSPEHRLIAVSSNTTNTIYVYQYETSDQVGVTVSLRHVDTVFVKSPSSSSSSSSAAPVSKGADSVVAEEVAAQLRVKGISFQPSSNSSGSTEEVVMRVLVGVKIDNHAGFFSSGASNYAVELRTYSLKCFDFSSASNYALVNSPFVQPLPPCPPLSPHPEDVANSCSVKRLVEEHGGGVSGGGGGESFPVAAVLDALQSFRSHVDARMDRMEGMLMMQSERLSRLERNRERCDA
jgi:hypothetical protein